jgi:elongation factor P--beta-lysine ligase
MSGSMLSNVKIAREALYANIRTFFASQQIIEIETSLFPFGLSAPESPIFNISRQFREETKDRRHCHEFSVLQWSQPNWVKDQVLVDLDAFLMAIFAGEFEPERRTFRQAFIQRLAFDPDGLSAADLRQEARRLGLNVSLGEDRLAWLKLMFVHFIEPTLGIDVPLYLVDLPSEWRDTTFDSEPKLQSHIDIYIDGIKVGSVLGETLSYVEQTQQPRVYQHIFFGIERLLMIILETRRIEKVKSILRN